MYCPNCGKPDQVSNSYCRSCGDFLVDPKAGRALTFGRSTPQQNLNAINILSLLAAFLSIVASVWMYITHFNVPIALSFGAAILFCSACWHLSNFVIGMKLKKRLGKSKKALIDTNNRQTPRNDSRTARNERRRSGNA